MILTTSQNLVDFALTLFYPQICELCGASVEARKNGFVCADCWLETKIFAPDETLCFKCGRLMQGFGAAAEKVNCRQCAADFYDFARAAGDYSEALRISILRLKKEPFVAPVLRDLLLQTFENGCFSAVTKILPVPLSERRRKERGFNQAEILAEILARKTGIKADFLSLERTRHTEKIRTGMDRIEREKTVKEAFAVARPRLVEGENILLIDDVFTSGATVSNCAKALKEQGAKQVFVLTVARA